MKLISNGMVSLLIVVLLSFAGHAPGRTTLQRVPNKPPAAQIRQRKFEGKVSGKPSSMAFVLVTTAGRMRVDASRATIVISGKPAKLSDLRDGMIVAASGKMLGAMLMATQVDAKLPTKR